MMSGAVRISIIVPHRDDWARLQACVDDLIVQSADVGDCEIIVVDNGSRDQSKAAAFMERCGRQIVFATEPEQGAACARNTGTRLARGNIFVFIDCDCRPSRDWLLNLVACIQQHGYCGGQVNINVSAENPSPAESFEKIFAFHQVDYINKKKFSVTANLGVRRDIFEDVGPFRNGVSEDRDWGQRAAAKGHRIVFCPNAVVSHPPRRTYAELRRKWRRLCREEVYLGRLNGEGVPAEVRRIAIVAFSPLAHAPKCLFSRDLTPRARLGCLVALFHIRWYRVWRYAIELVSTARGGQGSRQAW